MSQSENNVDRSSDESIRAQRRRRKKRKRPVWKQVLRWVQDNPLKLVAIACLVVLIYVTFLFILRSREERTLKGLPGIKSSSIE
ncbi:MAG: hypothetical protein ABJA57_02125 [Ginsengibacter sp.]